MTNSSHLERVARWTGRRGTGERPVSIRRGEGWWKGATGPVRRGEGRLAPLLPGLVKGLEAR